MPLARRSLVPSSAGPHPARERPAARKKSARSSLRGLLHAILFAVPLAACHDTEAPLTATPASEAAGHGMTRGGMSSRMTPLRVAAVSPAELPGGRASFAIEAPPSAAGPSHIVWQNVRTGLRVFWHMSGRQWGGSQNELMTIDTAWTIVASEDFTYDGHADLLWQRRSTGEQVIWKMDAFGWTGEQYGMLQVWPEWWLVGAADFTGDAAPDLIWQNKRTGEVVIWKMVGPYWSSEKTQYSVGQVDPRWSIAGVGDFTGDGKPDILWQDQAAGRQVIWHMNGTSWDGAQNELFSVSPEWHIVAAADFSGDRRPDILWQSPREGRQVIWEMNGTNWDGAQNELMRVDPEWRIATTIGRRLPSVMTKAAGDAQRARAGAVLPASPAVRVTDAFGNPVRTGVTFSVTSGSIMGATAYTDANGVARAGAWTLGSTPGEQRLTATAGGVTAIFTAIATDPCSESTPDTLNTSVTGRLEPGDCMYTKDILIDYFKVIITHPTYLSISMTGNSFEPKAYLFDENGKLLADSERSSTSLTHSITAIIPAGNYYRIGASSSTPTYNVRYNVGAFETTLSVKNCSAPWLVPGLGTSQQLDTTDCALAGGRYADEYRVRLSTGQTVTVTENSRTVDAYLDIVRESAGAVVAQDDNGVAPTDARITFTARTEGTYRIRASAAAGQTGAYSLVVR